MGFIAAVVATFGVALVPLTGYMTLQRVQDTKTPALITTGVTVIGVAGCLATTWLLPRADIVVGIPLAKAAAYTAGSLAAAILRRRLWRIDGHRQLRTHARVAVAAGVAGSWRCHHVCPDAPDRFWLQRGATLTAAGVRGAAVFAAAARLVRRTEL